MKQKDWFKERGYLHLTNKIPFSKRSSIFKYISNPNKIGQHSFYPLIFKEITQRRFKKSDFNGSVRRSHKKIDNNKVVSNKKIRPILYATHIDANIYAYYTHEILGKKYETLLSKTPELSKCITAYRRIRTENDQGFKNNIHFAKDVFDEVKKRKNCVAIAIDIKSFFNNLNHQKLKNDWKKLLNVTSLPKDHYNIYKAVTNYSYIKLNDLKQNQNHFNEKQISKNKKQGKHSYFLNFNEFLDSNITIYKSQPKDKKDKEQKGIPQGLPISALLANLYMYEFDNAVYENLVKKEQCFYRRYSDDIVVISSVEKIDTVIDFIASEIKKYKLDISVEKTEKTLFKTHKLKNKTKLQSFRIEDDKLKFNIPLNYLGFEFYGYQTLIKSKNLGSFYREMKETVKRKSKRIEQLKEKKLTDNLPLFKRKIYRLYSYKGVKKRFIKHNKILLDGTKKEYEKKYRGNFIKYAYKASEILEAPEIKKQIKNHWKILQKTISNFKFSNKN